VVAEIAVHRVGAGATVDRIVAKTAVDRIVAAHAEDGVVPAGALDLVGEVVRRDLVVRIVAEHGNDGAAFEYQVLDVRQQRVLPEAGLRARDDDRVGAFVGVFRDAVEEAVDDVGVVATATGHAVAAGPAVEDVVAVISGERVVAAVAGGVHVGGAGHQDEVLDVGRQRVAHRYVEYDRVDAAAGLAVVVLDHPVSQVVDMVGVVAEAADHAVGAGAAVDGVVALAAEDRVVATESFDDV